MAETMVNGKKSGYNGKIGLSGQQVVKAPIAGKTGNKPGGVKTGRDLRTGK